MNRFIPLFILPFTLAFLLCTIKYYRPYQAAYPKDPPVPSAHIGITISTLHKEAGIYTTNDQGETDATADNDTAVQSEADAEKTIWTGNTTETESDILTGNTSETKSDVATGNTSETKSGVATGNTSETKSDVATGNTSETKSDMATGNTAETATDTTTDTAADTTTGASTDTATDTTTDTAADTATDTATTQSPATNADDETGCNEATQSPNDICLSYPSDLVAAINTYRNSYGLASLSYDSQLNQAAGIRCRELINSMSHTRPDGSSCSTIYSEVGIYPYNWGENLAGGHYTASETAMAWMNSDGHRANILNPSFTRCGVAHISSSSGYRDYWVILFTD